MSPADTVREPRSGPGDGGYAAALRREFLEETAERLERLHRDLDLVSDAASHSALMTRLRREGHTLKGMSQSHDLAALAAVAHRLEEFLAVHDSAMAPGDQRLRQWLSALLALVERLERPPLPDPRELETILAGLPRTHPLDPRDIQPREALLLLVTSARVLAQMVAAEVRNCGYQATVTANPFEALWLAVQLRPQVILCSSQLEGISGVDLVRALAAVEATHSTPVALVTSFAAGHPMLARLPPGVPLIRVGADLHGDLAQFLSGPNVAA